MEHRHLRYFVAVAEEESFTRAAARLHVSQPPLSRQIQDLERELGVTLFARSTKAVRLTDAGRIFYSEAVAILDRADEAVELIRSVGRGHRGRVRVGYAASPTVEILPRILRVFKRAHRQIRVDLHDMSTQGMLRGLRDGTLDVALVVSIATGDLTGLNVEELGTYPVRVAFHRRHRFARLREVRLADVAREPLVTFSRDEYPEAHSGLGKILSPFTRSPKIVGEYASALSLIAAVEAGEGAALVFNTLALLAGDRVLLRPVKPEPDPLPVSLAWRKGGNSMATEGFVAAAREARARPSPSRRQPLSTP